MFRRFRNQWRVDARPLVQRGAHVELIDRSGVGSDSVIFPTEVWVNGVDVGLLAENGFKLESGSWDEPTTVTLVLFPAHVEIKRIPTTKE